MAQRSHLLCARGLLAARCGLAQLLLPAMVLCESSSYDLVLVDGLHTFEQSVIDMYYADLLLR